MRRAQCSFVVSLDHARGLGVVARLAREGEPKEQGRGARSPPFPRASASPCSRPEPFIFLLLDLTEPQAREGGAANLREGSICHRRLRRSSSSSFADESCGLSLNDQDLLKAPSNGRHTHPARPPSPPATRHDRNSALLLSPPPLHLAEEPPPRYAAPLGERRLIHQHPHSFHQLGSSLFAQATPDSLSPLAEPRVY